ncbi:MAG TPA: inositol monophosphatase family protein, partial [Polyangiaceae bacterium]
GFPPDRSDPRYNNFEAYMRAKRRARGVRRCGSAALDLCLVADGTYDAYWERALHAWDVVAGAAIVLAAGGTITALDGNPPELEIGHLIASNGSLHPALLELVGEQPMLRSGFG